MKAHRNHLLKSDNSTNNTFDVQIKWLIKKIKNLLRVKDKSLHQASKIYEDFSSCGKRFSGKTIRNVK